MKKYVTLFLVLQQSSMVWAPQALGDAQIPIAGARDQGFDQKDSERKVICDQLAPLKEVSENIETKVSELDELLKREEWNDELISEVLNLYASLDRIIDAFPFLYRESLYEIKRKYRDDEKLSDLISKYDAFYWKVPLTHRNDTVELLKEAHQLFHDVRVLIKHPHPSLIPFNFDRLAFYQTVSLPDKTGLEHYFRSKAQDLFQATKALGIAPKPLTQCSSTASYKKSVFQPSTTRGIEAQKEQIRKEFDDLAKCNSILTGLAREMSIILQKPLLQESDLLKLVVSYKKFSYVLYHGNRSLKNKVGASCASLPERFDLYSDLDLVKHYFLKDCDRFYDDFFKQLESMRQQGIDGLEEALETFACGTDALQKYSEQQQGASLASIFGGLWFSRTALYSEEFLERVVALLVWTSPSRLIQDAVRIKAYSLLHEINEKTPTEKVRLILETMRAFIEGERMLADEMSKDEGEKRLVQLQNDLKSTLPVSVKFREGLLRNIDCLLEGVPA